MSHSDLYLQSRTPQELGALAALPQAEEVSTQHQGFNKEANHPERGYVGTGNVISGVQQSTFVRAESQTSCNGYEFEPGELRKSDMKMFGRTMPQNMRDRIEDLSATRDLIVYEFSSPVQGGPNKTHGWLITDTFYRHLETASVPGQKSMSIMHDMTRRLSWKDHGLEDPEGLPDIISATQDITTDEISRLAETLGQQITFSRKDCRAHSVYFVDERPISAFSPGDITGSLVRSDSPAETAAMMCLRAGLDGDEIRDRISSIRIEQQVEAEYDSPGPSPFS